MTGEEIRIGAHVRMKKPHACGSNEWEITRTGADIRIKCVSCLRSVMLDRCSFIKNARELWEETDERKR